MHECIKTAQVSEYRIATRQFLIDVFKINLLYLHNLRLL